MPANLQNEPLRTARSGPFLAASLIYLLLFGLALAHALNVTDGRQPFLLDDPYIHASLARGLLHYGQLTVTTQGFSSASSSIAWPFLLAAGFAIAGQHLWVILALNILSAIAALYVADRLLVTLSGNTSFWPRAIVLSLLAAGASLVELTLVGMEHNLQIFTVLLLALSFVKVWNGESRSSLALCLSGFAAACVRYEAAFPVLAMLVLLVARRKFRPAILLAIGAAAPVVAFSLYGLSQGAMLLPNSLSLKNSISLYALSLKATQIGPILYFYGGYFAVLILAYFTLWPNLIRTPALRAFLLASTGAAILHFALGQLNWGLRYEAYLVALLIIGVAAIALSSPARSTAVIQLAGILLLLIPRICFEALYVQNAPRSIYVQQYQMARFLSRYYPNQVVGVNDIGIVSYWKQTNLLDMYGLANTEIARLKHSGDMDDSAMAQILARNHVRVAILYPDWFNDLLPDDVTPVGQWQLSGDMKRGESIGFRSVTIYAISPDDVAQLKANLAAFSPCLPKEVIQSGYDQRPNAKCDAPDVPQGWLW